MAHRLHGVVFEYLSCRLVVGWVVATIVASHEGAAMAHVDWAFHAGHRPERTG